LNAKHPNTALLVFSRTAAEEAQIKKFAGLGNGVKSFKIANALYNKSLSLTKHLKQDIFISLGSDQTGNTFGERLANEADNIFALGYQHLLIIGTDSPQITADHINKASAKLESGEHLVIGPTHENGAYLIGITRESYNRETFIGLPWQTSALLTSWIQLAEEICFLEQLADINSEQDLRAYLARPCDRLFSFDKILQFILLDKQSHEFLINSPIYLEELAHLHFFRGPPMAA